MWPTYPETVQADQERFKAILLQLYQDAPVFNYPRSPVLYMYIQQ